MITREEYDKWMWENDPGFFELMKEDDKYYSKWGEENPGKEIMSEREKELYKQFLVLSDQLEKGDEEVL